MDKVVRIVLGIFQFFQNDQLLLFDFLFREQRKLNQIGKNVDGKLGELIQHARVVTRMFLGGKSVQIAADRFRLRAICCVERCPSP